MHYYSHVLPNNKYFYSNVLQCFDSAGDKKRIQLVKCSLETRGH